MCCDRGRRPISSSGVAVTVPDRPALSGAWRARPCDPFRRKQEHNGGRRCDGLQGAEREVPDAFVERVGGERVGNADDLSGVHG